MHLRRIDPDRKIPMLKVVRLFLTFSVLALAGNSVHAGPYADIHCPGKDWKDWQCKAFTGANDR